MNTEDLARDRADMKAHWYREGWFRDETLAEAILRAARAHPDTPYHFSTESGLTSSTSGEIAETGRRLGAAFQAIGIGPGDVVAFQLPTQVETAVLYVAALCAGATLLPIVHLYGPSEVEFILRKARAKALIVPQRWRHIDYLERVEALNSLPDLEHVIVLGERAPPGGRLFRDFAQAAREDFAPVHTDPDGLALLLFTSGTTGEPKGVMQSHNTVRCEWEKPFIARSGPHLNPTPAGHIQGFNFLFRPMFFPVPMVMMDRWEPVRAGHLIQELGVSQTGGAPYFMMSLLEAAREHGLDISSLKVFGLGGATVTPEHVRIADRMGMTGARAYGSTEFSTVTQGDLDASLEVRATTDGRLQIGVELRVLDTEDRDLGFGNEGELLVRGPEHFMGYFDPAHDVGNFQPGGWFRTGDIGKIDEQGYVTITDRKKDIIIRGGENISSMEVENILMSHPDVVEAAVVAMPDLKFGERVCAYIVPRPGASVTLQSLFEHCVAGGHAKHMAPEHIEMIDELPRTPTGKVRKHQLRDQLLA
jgi:acyl-CoA synthetase